MNTPKTLSVKRLNKSVSIRLKQNSYLGRRAKKRRCALRLTQQDVAKKIGTEKETEMERLSITNPDNVTRETRFAIAISFSIFPFAALISSVGHMSDSNMTEFSLAMMSISVPLILYGVYSFYLYYTWAPSASDTEISIEDYCRIDRFILDNPDCRRTLNQWIVEYGAITYSKVSTLCTALNVSAEKHAKARVLAHE